MNQLTRYMLKAVAIALLFATACLTFAVWLTQILRFLELVVDAGAPASIFFQLLILTVPKFLEIVLPISLLGSILFIYNKLLADNEIIVMKAAGLDTLTIIKPVIILTGFLSLFLFILGGWLAPMSHAQLQSLKNHVKSHYSSVLLREGVFNSFNDDFTVFVREKLENNHLKGILIHQSSEKETTPSTIFAKEGQLIQDEDTIKIILKEGSRQQQDSKTGYVSRLDFDNYTVDITPEKQEKRQRWVEPDERLLTELLQPNIHNRRDVLYYPAFVADFHRRITSPFLMFSFAMIAVCCLLKGSFDRRGQNKRILQAVVLTIITQAAYLSFVNLSASNNWYIIATYIIAILPTLICWYLLIDQERKQMERETKI